MADDQNVDHSISFEFAILRATHLEGRKQLLPSMLGEIHREGRVVVQEQTREMLATKRLDYSSPGDPAPASPIKHRRPGGGGPSACFQLAKYRVPFPADPLA